MHRLSVNARCDTGSSRASRAKLKAVVFLATIVAVTSCGDRGGSSKEAVSSADEKQDSKVEVIVIAYFHTAREKRDVARGAIVSIMEPAGIPVFFEGKSGYTDVLVLEREVIRAAREILESNRPIVMSDTSDFRVLQENGSYKKL